MVDNKELYDLEVDIKLLLSGYSKELDDGNDFEITTHKTTQNIIKLFNDVSKCLKCGINDGIGKSNQCDSCLTNGIC